MPDHDYTVVRVELTEDYREGLIDIAWGTKTAGFGHLSFNNKDGKIHCSNEGMSRKFVKEVLDKLVDEAVFEAEDEADPVRFEDGAWYWWDETWSDRTGPYDTRQQAVDACVEYCKILFETEEK